MRYIRFTITTAALVLLAMAPAPAAAQTCGQYCEYGVILGCDCPNEGEHAWYDVETGFHRRMGTTSHDCQLTGYHGTCGFDGPAEAVAAYRAIVEAAGVKNVLTMLTLAPLVADRVAVDTQRQLVLVRSCSGSAFVASISYADDFAAATLAGEFEKLEMRRAQLAMVTAITASRIVRHANN